MSVLADPVAWVPAVVATLVLAGWLVVVARRLRTSRERERQLQQVVEERTRQLEAVNRTLRDTSDSDGLTAIANHRSFQDSLRRQWRRTARSRLPMTVLMIDVDELRHYNEVRGQQSGDECLRQVAETLRDQLQRPGDLVARYGGDEFAALLSETDGAGGLAVAEKMREAVEDLDVTWGPDPESQRITVSIGVATTVPSPQESPSSLVAAADRALAVAKRSGGNRIEM